MKDLSVTSTTLALPDDSSTAIVCSDASDSGWSVIVSQVATLDPRVPVTTQLYKLLACLGETSKGHS
ncbi:hypothetical protein PI124_g19646 [Phytophthora idaei]|nr:hypothetical protein PI125_g22227 [Phytophthora idaei]KAG3130576.1 hypothetical protein PI126_g20438 [Phytophthora idaei]KAG3235318.1 hypothetical protein PI124_g19646 [Phytophthora idaei]